LRFSTDKSSTPIIPVIVGEVTQAMALGRELLTAGVYVQTFAYPVVAQGAAQVRCIVFAAHRRDDLDEALAAFATAGKTLRLI
jgi:glycine C-acetyltransferase